MARRFRFQLDTLLRVRQLRQREAERRLATRQADLLKLDQLRTQTADEIDACQQRLRQHQEGRVDPRDLTGRQAWIMHLRRCLASAEQQRAAIQQELRELRQNVQVARTQTRMLEKLRERRADEHRRSVNHQQQAQAEEVARQLHIRRNDAPASA